LNILRALHGHTSGMAIPRYVIDAPGGGGKITVVPPEFVLEMNSREVILKNYEDQVYRYPQVQQAQSGEGGFAPCGGTASTEDSGRPIPLQRLPR
jgi:lysine 2,3-aminomutase